MNDDAAIYKAAELLRASLPLLSSLRATQDSAPRQMVVLDGLEAHLKDLDELLATELKNRHLLDEARCWNLLSLMFKTISWYLFKIIDALPCKLSLFRQSGYKLYEFWHDIKIN